MFLAAYELNVITFPVFIEQIWSKWWLPFSKWHYKGCSGLFQQIVIHFQQPMLFLLKIFSLIRLFLLGSIGPSDSENWHRYI